MPVEPSARSVPEETGPAPVETGSGRTPRGWLRQLDAWLRPRIRHRGTALLQRARQWPRTVRREIERRGASPRAWLGEPRDWTTIRRKRFWVAAAVLTYLGLGFFAAPWIARREIVAALQKTFERPVTLSAVRINPLRLSADLRGFRITEKDGSPLAAFDRLYVRLQLLSPLRWAWCFDEIELDGADGEIVRYTPTDTNIGRLLQALASPDAQSGTDKGPIRLAVDRLEIKNTTVSYTDHVPANLFKTAVGPIYVKFTRLSTLPDRQGKQHVFVTTEGGANLEWTGTFKLNPIESVGHIRSKGPYAPVLTRYFEDMLKFSAVTGDAASDLDYRLLTRPDGALALTVDRLSFALSDVALRQTGADAPFLTLPALHLAGGHLAWPENVAGADSLSVEGLGVTVRRQPDGQIDLMRLAAGAKSAPPQEPQPAAPDQAAAASPWSLALGAFEIKNAKARIVDDALRTPGAVEITGFDLEAQDLSNKPGARFPLALALQLAPGGRFTLQGQFSALPQVQIDAKLTASDVRLAAAQAYLHEAARLRIDDGRLNFETDLKLEDPDHVTASGHGDISALKLVDEADGTPALAWERVAIDGYTYSKADNALQISQVSVGAPFLRFLVAKDRTTNFSHILIARNEGQAAPAGPETPAPAAAGDGKAGAPAAMAISVGKIAVARGAADYADESLPLPFAAHITNLEGDVASLASATTTPARLSLHGQVGEFGEAKIEGALTPFDPAQSTRIDILFRNVEFPGLSPYTVKFAGQRIAKGRLDVSLKYAIDAGKLQGANRVVIRNIELGEKVDVPGAMNLPLGLAIAVLKDQDGKIDVDLPVSGDINDPKFAFGGVIWKAIANLLTNIVTSPFQALAGLVGGDGGKLDHIDFEAGRAALSPPEKEKVQQLAKALQLRPNLALVVPGVTDPDADRFKLQLDAVDAQMAQKLAERNTLERQRRFLERAFKDKIGKDALEPLERQFTRPPAGQPDASPVLDEAAFVAALREQVAKAEPIDDAALESLAQARAAAVADALKDTAGLDPKRITVRPGATVKADDAGMIPMKLDAATLANGS